MSSETKRLALFGGTFDPVHNGHLDLAERSRATCRLDRVVFVPCARSPLKADAAPQASAEQRLAMLDLAIAERGWHGWAETSRFEIDRDPPSYSWQTAAHFRETEAPDTEFFWIVGGDQWTQIERWAEPEKLRAWLHFIVVTRAGSGTEPRPGWRATFLEFDHPASATALREGHGDPGWLSNSVADYIRENDLYSQEL